MNAHMYACARACVLACVCSSYDTQPLRYGRSVEHVRVCVCDEDVNMGIELNVIECACALLCVRIVRAFIWSMYSRNLRHVYLMYGPRIFPEYRRFLRNKNIFHLLQNMF